MIVADTCLVFHLFNETFLTNCANKLLERDPYWVLPPLWREEYANVLSKLARKESRAIDEVISHFNYTLDELKNCEINVDTKKAIQISMEYNISVYDAHFVSLAKDLNTLLVTEDKEILKNCPHLSLSIQTFLEN